MKKRLGVIGGIAGVLAIAAIVLLIGKHKFGWFNPVSEASAELARELESYDADIIVYGNLQSSRKSVIKYRTVEKLNDENLTNTEAEYHIIVLCDIDGALNLDEDDLLNLNKYGFDEHYDILYFGNAHMNELMETLWCNVDMSGEWSFWFNGYAYRYGFPFEYDGFEWKYTDVE